MKIKKLYLPIFYYALKGTEGQLSLAESRVRDSAMKMIREPAATFEQDRTKIFTTYCDKDEKGKPKIEDGKYSFDPELLETINGELSTLNNEEVELEIHNDIKEILEKTNYKPKVGEAEVIDEIKSCLTN